MTLAEYEEHKKRIDAMSQMEMARVYRYSHSGHPYFTRGLLDKDGQIILRLRGEPELFDYFLQVFKSKGGMTPEVSKAVGWDGQPGDAG